jgi:hypothetical protein
MACIQERLMMARVRYMKLSSLSNIAFISVYQFNPPSKVANI